MKSKRNLLIDMKNKMSVQKRAKLVIHPVRGTVENVYTAGAEDKSHFTAEEIRQHFPELSNESQS